jgi:hypothetical protein
MKRCASLAIVAGLMMLVACATTRVDDAPEADASAPEVDGGLPSVDAGSDAEPDAAPDASRPTSCGDAGFCETRLPEVSPGVPVSLRAVWAVAENDVWSVSAEGFVLHYDGTSWTASYRVNRPLYAVWASETDVWAGGEDGVLVHKNSAGEWTFVETGHLSRIRSIYGTSANDVWFTSRESSVDHFDGTKLTNLSIDVPKLVVTTVFGRNGFGTYAAGYARQVPEPSEGVEYVPYVFELTPTAIGIYNASLSAQKGFFPISAVVTDSASEEQRIFMTGTLRTDSGEFDEPSTSTTVAMPRFCTMGSSSDIALRGIPGTTELFREGAEVQPSVSAWGAEHDNIVMPLRLGAVFRWDGTQLQKGSLNMPPSFMSRKTYDVHGVGTELWIVGDGLALRGPAR